MKYAVQTPHAPPPAGTYSQAIAATGNLIFIAGQTPRRADGTRLIGASFNDQAVQTMENLKAVAEAVGGTLEAHCVKVTVYLKNLDDRFVFDKIFAGYVGEIPPARAIVQSNFVDFDIEVDAILAI